MDTTGKRLRLLYPDIHGLERGKYLFGSVAESGHAAFCIGVYPLTHDREILEVPNTQFDIGLPDIDVHLDRDSLRHSWEPETVIGIGDATRGGEPVPIDPRRVLREAVEAWRALGLEPQISFELEFYLMEHDGGAGWRPISLPGHRVYGTGTAVDPTGCVDAMVTTALACGFNVETWNSEYDEAAFEVNIRYDDALTAADDAFIFRLLIREIAEHHGKLATFLGRPLNDRGGSGMHVNFSFRRDDGSNAFHDPNDPEGLSDLARQCARACSSTTPAWRRSWRRTSTPTSGCSPTCSTATGPTGDTTTAASPSACRRPGRGDPAGATHRRRCRQPVPGGRRGVARRAIRRRGPDGAEAAAADRRRPRYRRGHPGEPVRGAGRTERR